MENISVGMTQYNIWLYSECEWGNNMLFNQKWKLSLFIHLYVVTNMHDTNKHGRWHFEELAFVCINITKFPSQSMDADIDPLGFLLVNLPWISACTLSFTNRPFKLFPLRSFSWKDNHFNSVIFFFCLLLSLLQSHDIRPFLLPLRCSKILWFVSYQASLDVDTLSNTAW